MKKNCCLCNHTANTLIDDLPICLNCLKVVNDKWFFWSIILDKVKAYYERNLNSKIINIDEYRKQKKGS